MSEESMFARAMELPDGSQRTAYLEAACDGNPVLLQNVQTLLANYKKMGDFLQKPVLEQIAAMPATLDATEQKRGHTLDFLQPSSRAGSLGRIGNYEVLNVIGVGEFGTVLKRA